MNFELNPLHALAALKDRKRDEAKAPEDTKQRREKPWDESPEGTMVETGEDWIGLPDETPEAEAEPRRLCRERSIRSPHLPETTSSLLPCSRKASRSAAAGRRIRGAHVGRC